MNTSLLSDGDALTLARALPGEQDGERKAAMAAALGAYRDAKVKAGEKPFVASVDAQYAQDTRYEALYAGLDTVDTVLAPEQRTQLAGLLANSGDASEDKARMVNQAYLADIYGDKLPGGWDGDNWPSIRGQFAKKAFGIDKAELSDKELFAAIGGKVKQKKDERALLAKMINDVAMAAFDGSPDYLDAYAKVASAMEAGEGYDAKNRDRYRAIAKAAFGRMKEKTDALRPVAQRIVGSLARLQETDPFFKDVMGYSMDDLVSMVGEVADEDRRLLYSVVAREAAKSPDAQPDKSFLYQLGETISRSGKRNARWSKEAVHDLPARIDKRALAARADKVTVTGVRKPGESVAEWASRSQIGGYGIVDFAADVIAQKGQPFLRDRRLLTEEEQESLRAEVADTERRGVILGELRDIAEGVVDPVKGNAFTEKMVYPAAESLVYSAQTLIPGVGFPLLISSTLGMRSEEARRRGVPIEEAQKLALGSALIEAPLEFVQAKMVLGMLPGAKGLLTKPVTSLKQLSGRAAVVFGIQTVEQNFLEAAQDITPLVLQEIASRFSDAFPDVDWKTEMMGKENPETGKREGGYLGQRVDTAWAMVPMTLIGTGSATFSDAAYGAQYLSNITILKAAGFTEEAAQKIALAPTVEEKTALINSLWNDEHLRPLNAAAQQAAFSELDADMRASYEENRRDDGAPQITRNENGTWTVYDQTGAVVDTAESVEAALELVKDVNGISETNEAEVIREMVEYVERFQEPGQSIELIDTPRRLQDRVTSGEYTQEEAQAIVDSYIALGQMEAGTTPDMVGIAGENEVTRYDAMRRVVEDVSRIYATGKPITVIEEHSEGYLKRRLSDGTVTLEDIQRWRDATEGGKNPMNERTSIEWFSEKAQAYMVGKIESAEIPSTFRAWFRRMRAYYKRLVEAAAQLMAQEAAGTLPKDFKTHLARSVGLDAAYIDGMYREQERAAMEDPGAELSAWIKGRLPHPDDAKEAGEALTGELRDLFNGMGSRQKAAAFFARKGGDGGRLDKVTEAAREAGFPYETPGELLEALDNSLRGIKQFPTYTHEDSRGTGPGTTFSLGGVPELVAPTADELAKLRQRGETTFSLTPAPVFYSRLIRTVEQSPQGKASGAQWKATIKNSKLGVNADEFALVGVNDLEDGKTYTKAEVLEYLRANEVKVSDVTLGGAFSGEPRELTEYDAQSDQVYKTDGSNEKADVVIRRYSDGKDEIGAIIEYENEADSPQGEGFDERFVVESSKGNYSKGFSTLKDAEAYLARDIEQPKGPPTEFESYTLPGAIEGSYREVLLTVPESEESKKAIADLERRVIEAEDAFANTPTPIGVKEGRAELLAKRSEMNDRVEALRKERDAARQKSVWRDGHSQYSDIANPVVRLRYNERVTADGKRMLFLEEVQGPQAQEFEKMPDLFKKNWRDIGFKWALRKAVDGGFDVLGWTTGEQQAARYSLSSKVDEIHWSKDESTGETTARIVHEGDSQYFNVKDGIVQAERTGGGAFTNPLNGKALEDVLGKEVATRILSTEGGVLEGDGLNIGGHGLKQLYDVDFRNVVNKLAVVKKAGQKVGTVGIEAGVRREGDEEAMPSRPVDVVEGYGGFNVVLENGMKWGSWSDEAAAKNALARFQKEYDAGKWTAVNALTLTEDMKAGAMQGQATFAMESDRRAKEIKDGMKMRRIAERIVTGEHAGQAFSPELRARMENMVYQVVPNKVTVQEAMDLVDAKGIQGAMEMVLDQHSPIQPRVRFTVAMGLMEHFNAAGKMDSAFTVGERVAELGTELGQGIQALSMFGRIIDTPEKAQLFLARQTKKAEKALKEKTPAIDAARDVMAEVQKEALKLLEVWLDQINGVAGRSKASLKPARVEDLPDITFSLTPEMRKSGIVSAVAGMLKESGAEATRKVLVERYGANVEKHIPDILIEAQRLIMVRANASTAAAKKRSTEKAKKKAEKAKAANEAQTETPVDDRTPEEIDAILDAIREDARKSDVQLDMTAIDEHFRGKRMTPEEVDNAIATARAFGLGNQTQTTLAGMEDITQRFEDEVMARMKVRGLDTPESVRKSVRKVFEMKGVSFTTADVSRIFNAIYTVPKATPAQQKRLTDLALNIRSTPDKSAERKDATIELLNLVGDVLKPVDVVDKVWAVWYANILSGYNTHFRNLYANFFEQAVSLPLDAMRANPVAMLHLMREMLYGVKAGAAVGLMEGKRQLMTGDASILQSEANKFGTSGTLERVNFGGGKVNPFNWLKVVGRALRAEDLFAYATATEAKARMVAWEMATQKGMTGEARDAEIARLLNATDEQIGDFKTRAAREWDNLTAELQGRTTKEAWTARRVKELQLLERDGALVERASEFAARATFNYKPEGIVGLMANTLTDLLSRASQLDTTGKQEALLKLVATAPKLFIPFVRIVANVLNRGIDYGGGGIVKSAFSKKLTGGATGIKMEAKTADERAMELKRGIFGVVMLGVLSAIADPDDDDALIQIHGSGSGSKEKNMALHGPRWMAYSIEIRTKGRPSRFFTYQYSPLAIGLAVVGGLHDAKRYRKFDEKETTARFAVAVTGVGAVLLDQSFLASAADLVNMFSRDGQVSEKAVISLIARTANPTTLAIPFANLVSNISRDLDPVKRDNVSIKAALLAYVPVASRLNDPALDVLGDAIESRPFDWFVKAERTGTPEARIYRAFAAKNVAPTSSWAYKGRMEPDQFYEFTKERGAWLKSTLLANNAELLGALETMDSDSAENFIENLSRSATVYAKAKVGFKAENN